MSREIKFRTWDTKNKIWLEEIPPEEYMLDTDEWHHPSDGDMASMIFPNCPLPDFRGRLIHQQYTGFKDHLNKEIYEGDIISLSYTKGHERDDSYDYYGKYKVVFDQGKWQLIGPFPKYNKEVEHLDLWLESSDYVKQQGMETFEIVGNIFENPDLLT